MTFNLTVNTVPVPKGRPKFTRSGRTYTPKKTADYEKLVRQHWLMKYDCVRPLETTLSVSIVFYMPIPKNTPKYKRTEIQQGTVFHAKKPDIDNLVKAVLDGLNGVAYKDDSRIAKLTAVKKYGTEPRVEVEIEAIK